MYNVSLPRAVGHSPLSCEHPRPPVLSHLAPEAEVAESPGDSLEAGEAAPMVCCPASEP